MLRSASSSQFGGMVDFGSSDADEPGADDCGVVDLDEAEDCDCWSPD